jgi:hypothetical protein
MNHAFGFAQDGKGDSLEKQESPHGEVSSGCAGFARDWPLTCYRTTTTNGEGMTYCTCVHPNLHLSSRAFDWSENNLADRVVDHR